MKLIFSSSKKNEFLGPFLEFFFLNLEFFTCHFSTKTVARFADLSSTVE